jgi:hypothetical protein
VCLSECTGAPESCPEGLYCLEANQEGRRFCYPHGDVPAYERCAGAYDCAPGAYCDQRNGDAEGVCLPGCGRDSDCAEDHWCFRTRTWSQCLPREEGQTGDSCASDGFSCAADHLCLYNQSEEAYCAEDCTGFPDRCGDGEVCRYFGYGVNLCFRHGERGHGDSCVGDAQACDAGSICAGVGQPGAICAQLCTFDPTGCPEGTGCVFTPGGLGVCLPEGFDPEEPFTGGPL